MKITEGTANFIIHPKWEQTVDGVNKAVKELTGGAAVINAAKPRQLGGSLEDGGGIVAIKELMSPLDRGGASAAISEDGQAPLLRSITGAPPTQAMQVAAVELLRLYPNVVDGGGGRTVRLQQCFTWLWVKSFPTRSR